ncbi:MAG: translocation/assembly module TamB, partial [Flavobacteriaceae bacterium]|nr:translocation/assembly module TamB [Flavobacteriaceae bacterium]
MVVLMILLSFSSVQTKLANSITSRVNDKYDTSILVEKVDLSSLKDVKLKNVLIKDHHQDTLIFVTSLNASILNIRNIIKGNLNFGNIEIDNGKFLMKTYKDEESNNLTIFVQKFNNEEKTNSKPFQLTASSIALSEVKFSLIDENKKDTPIVFYHHISAFFDDFKIYDTNVSAFIHGLKTVENHKINIIDFKTNFSYSNTKMEFLQSELKTEKSNLVADVIFNYKEGDLSNFTDKVQIDAIIKKGDIALPDLKKLYDEFGKNDQIHFSANLKGTINDFVLDNVDLKSDRNSSFKGAVHLENALYPEKFKLHADIKKVSSSYDHLINLFPKLLGNKLPTSLEKVGYFTSNGKVSLTKSSIDLKLNTQSEIGASKADIQLTNFDKIDEALYNGEVELIDFKLGKFVGDSLIGEFSMIGEVKGKGFSIDKINININGNISKHQYKGYTYTNIDINGILKDKHFDGKLTVNDPNIKLEFKGLADLSTTDYIFNFNANVDYANFNTLNLFTRDSISILKGIIDINLHGSNLDNIEGELGFKEATYVNQNENYQFKDFLITSKINDSIREVKIISTDIINGSIKGNFKFKELEKLTKNSLGSLYDNYQKEEVSKGQFLEFNFNIYNKIIDVFFPSIKLGANTIIRGELNSDEDKLELVIKSPKIKAYDLIIDDIRMQVDSKNPLFNTLLSVNKIDTKYYNVAEVNLVNVVLNDTLFIRTDFKGGKELKENFNLSFYHTINENGQSIFGIKKSDIYFKNNTWDINPKNNNQNKLVFDHSLTTYAIDNINMVSNNQQFINLAGFVGGDESTNIDLKLENVNLYDVTPTMDSVIIGGKVNGAINLKKVNGITLPFADIKVNYFSINDDYYGDLTLNAYGDESIKNYKFESKLENSDLISFFTKGNIDFKEKNTTINAEVAFDKFRINAFSPLGKNVLNKIRGFATGKATITGSIQNPSIDGEIILKEAGIALPYLNVNYNFLGESTVKLYGQTFDFQKITVQDDVMNTHGVMEGTITHTEFKKWNLDLELSTNNLLVLHTKETEDALYYGTGLLSGKTTLKGLTDELIIDVVGKTNPGTEFIMPLSDVSTVNESKLIHFENANAFKEDEKVKKEIVFKELKGLSINFDLEVTKDAVAEIVIDKISGSILKGSVEGKLALNIDTNGKFEMYGTLVVDNGEYQFKNIVNKDFVVKKGGTIVWDGSPFDAELNIEAVNHTKANPAVLLDEIASSRKIDVDLITIITGSLSSPNLEFDVQIPNASSIVSSELDFKLNKEDDMLNQFIALLVTGSFSSTEQDKTNFDSNAAIAGTIAQKAS